MVIFSLASSSTLEATADTMKASSSDPVQVTDPIEDMSVDFGVESTVIELTGRFDDPVFDLSRFSTVLGTIDLKLFQKEAPLTVANFLNYVKSGAYTNSFIHRSARLADLTPFVIQGGGFGFYDFEDPNPEVTDYVRIPTDPPVPNEPGISNLRGTIAMAKLSGDPDSATSQWFFNLSDNSAILDDQNGGFTVFGEVLYDGMNVVDAIANVPRWDASGINSAFGTLPLIDYANVGILPDENDLVLVNSIEQITELSFNATSDRPDIVLAMVDDNALHLEFAENQVCVAKITVRATASDERFVEDVFTVVIGGDLDGDGEVNLADAILALSVQTGLDPAGLRPDYSSSGADINEDNRIGIEEAMFILSVVSENW
jgi:peptidyl-prolyl cis-trans isomerase A (cyclophilin A)